ncbi:hypothetical protein Ancab_033616 [Ancistrocladus abbreviatus]
MKEHGEEGEVQLMSPAPNSKELGEINNEPRRIANTDSGMVNHFNDKSSLFLGVFASGYINSVPSLRAMKPSFYSRGNVGETKETSLGQESESGPEMVIGAGCEMEVGAKWGLNSGSPKLQRMGWVGLGFNLTSHKAPVVLDENNSLSRGPYNSRRSKTRKLVSSVKTGGLKRARKHWKRRSIFSKREVLGILYNIL